MSISDVLTKHADAFRQKTGVTNKLSISEMTNLMDSLKWGQSNLLKGTSDQYREANTSTTDHDDWVQMTTSNGNPFHYFPQDIMDNAKYFTYSGTVENMTKYTVIAELVPIGNDNRRINNGVRSGRIYPGQKDYSFSITCPVPKNCPGFQADCYYYGVGNGQSFRMKEERLYVGTLPGIWTPNPADKVGGNAV
ncbi:hypothetical protein H9564_02145 [Limosilactobacillus sp. Sa3CUN2]|uniref:Uncharacterized protein n=1 Tax=Limosilactobacillus avistercoris TaxID=2762243 RepID=A0ABR8PB97_9LACO|nr:hypothetical protein [Limosilactobacillus avistercoris]MBD7894532.1 hypothetical protein [Limosilactobacillus avistercoris]